MALSPDGFHYPSIGLHHYALRKPDRIAIRIGNRSLTYGELESRVGSLARCVLEDLTDLGEDIDRSDLIVPVFVDRGIESVVALHAMLRTGVGFALLDSALPASVVVNRWEQIGRPSMAVDPCTSLLTPRPVDPDLPRMPHASGGAVTFSSRWVTASTPTGPASMISSKSMVSWSNQPKLNGRSSASKLGMTT